MIVNQPEEREGAESVSSIRVVGGPAVKVLKPSTPASGQIMEQFVFVPLLELPWPYRVAKRALDIFVSATMLVVLFPLFLLISLAVKLTSKGPVLYRSTRIGAGGRPIRFVKFRTMFMDADQLKRALTEQNEKEGPIFKMKRDPRVTPVGRILRKFSLDELPQLIHVFLGEMSLVGPRPHLPQEVAAYEENCYERLSVRPGLTCFWQVQGRSDLSYEMWIELDVRYVRQMNLWLDIKLLAATPFAVLMGRGAY